MKKIAVLGGCIAAVLAICFADGYRQRLKVRPTLAGWQTPAVERERREGGNGEENIRVLIKTADFCSAYHEKVTLDTAGGLTLQSGAQECLLPAGEQVFTADSAVFKRENSVRLTANEGTFAIRGLKRERAEETYEGVLELRKTDQGLLLINELPLERYLCGVIPSEMPSSYPPEALKAQAVCARTYAKKCMQEQSAGDFFADLDDSVSYQVYNNQDRSPATDAAVEATAGVVLRQNGELLEAMYYSTSCGLASGLDLSQDAVIEAFLTADSAQSLEAQEPWYRWQTDILLANLGEVTQLQIEQRQKNGAVQTLLATYAGGEEKRLEGEYAIRQFLAGAQPVITLQDGETIEKMALLPSAFFLLQPLYEEEALYGYHVLGGGYGHGIGMSQNGAKQMALSGLKYEEILQNYYKNATLSKT